MQKIIQEEVVKALNEGPNILAVARDVRDYYGEKKIAVLQRAYDKDIDMGRENDLPYSVEVLKRIDPRTFKDWDHYDLIDVVMELVHGRP